jgi:hypothetical protein
MSVFYMVTTDLFSAIKEADGRGWTRIAMARYATPAKDEVRLVRRFMEMVPAADGTRFIRARDFPAEPVAGTDAGEFARFVADGHAEWVEAP